jgi:hypothetical protein
MGGGKGSSPFPWVGRFVFIIINDLLKKINKVQSRLQEIVQSAVNHAL